MTLKEARLAAGLKQTELAEMSGVNVRQIQRVESGESDIQNLTAKNLLPLCKALGVAPEELVGIESTGRVLKAKDVFTAEADALTAEERLAILKWEQAKEYSGLRAYPSTCEAVFERIPEEWLDIYSTKHIGEVAKLLKAAYDDGKQEG